jgi:hypothetical protein
MRAYLWRRKKKTVVDERELDPKGKLNRHCLLLQMIEIREGV